MSHKTTSWKIKTSPWRWQAGRLSCRAGGKSCPCWDGIGLNLLPQGLEHEEGVGQHHQSQMPMQAIPTAPLKVIVATFAFGILAVSRKGRSTLTRRPSSLITIGPITVDSRYNEVTVSSKTVRLTPIESKMLSLLAVNTNAVCTSEQTVSYVWGFNNEGESSLIKAHIRHLPQKVELDPGKPRFLLTIPGVGYTLEYRQEDKRASQEMAS